MSNVIITMEAGGTIKEGHAVKISTGKVVQITNAASDAILGVAMTDAGSGDYVAVCVSGDCKVAVADDDFGAGDRGIFTNSADGDKFAGPTGTVHFKVIGNNATIPVGETAKALVRVNLFPFGQVIA